MKRKTFLTLVISLLLVAMLLPSIGQSQSDYIVLPSQAKGTVSDADILELAYLMSWAKSTEVLGYLDALDEVLSPVVADITDVLGDDMPQLPDVAQMRAVYVAKIEAIKQAGTVANANSMIADLEKEGRALGDQMHAMETQLRGMEAPLRAQADVLEAQIRAQIEAEVEVKKAEITDELNALGQAKGDAVQADVTAQIEAEVSAAAAGGAECDAACQAGYQQQLDEYIAEVTADITAEMNAQAKQKEAELREWANQRAEELKAEVSQKFLEIEQKFENIGSLIEAAAAQKRAYYEETYYQKFKEKKVQVIRNAMEPQVVAAMKQMGAYSADIELARQEGRDIPALEDLVSELRSGADDLAQTIADSGSVEEVDEAVAGFEAFWAAKQADLELAHAQSTTELIDMVNQKMAEHNTERLIGENKQKIEQNIKALERLQLMTDLSPGNLEMLRRSRVILRLVEESEVLINEFKSLTTADDIAVLIEAKNRLKTKLEELQGAVDDFGIVPIPGDGIFIEAEDESYTKLLPHRAGWHSHEELNNPSWRPPLSGGGLWYFSRVGEVLGYRFMVYTAGNYIIWIRDIASLDWPVGARRFHIFVDGVDYGSFNENTHRTKYPPGTFAWHKTATVTLSQGAHVMEIRKTDDTRAGPLLDAIYMTRDPNDIPSEVGR